MLRMIRLMLVLAAVALGLTPAAAGAHAWSGMVDCMETESAASGHDGHGGPGMHADRGTAEKAKGALTHDCCLTAVQAILVAALPLAKPALSKAAEPHVPRSLHGVVITPSPPPPKIRV